MEIRRDFSLWAAIAIPVLMVIVVGAVVYFPATYVRPEGKFIYIDQGAGRFESKYEFFVKNGKIERREVEFSEATKPARVFESRIFVYDIAIDERNEIDFSEAQNLSLNDSRKSDKGFEIVEGRSGGLFEVGDFGTVFVKKGAYSKKLDLAGKKFYEIEFLGWLRT